MIKNFTKTLDKRYLGVVFLRRHKRQKGRQPHQKDKVTSLYINKKLIPPKINTTYSSSPKPKTLVGPSTYDSGKRQTQLFTF